MDKKLNKSLKNISRVLRKNMTRQEKHLWYDMLRNYPIKFYRQRVIGKYIADFYCAQAKLVIELDGAGHYRDKRAEKDKERTEYLNSMGLRVWRIPNRDIDRNFGYLCEQIDYIVNQLSLGKDVVLP